METICQCDSISYTSLQFWYPQRPGTRSPVDSKGTTVLETISFYLHAKIRAKDGVLWNKNVSHFGGEETEGKNGLTVPQRVVWHFQNSLLTYGSLYGRNNGLGIRETSFDFGDSPLRTQVTLMLASALQFFLFKVRSPGRWFSEHSPESRSTSRA